MSSRTSRSRGFVKTELRVESDEATDSTEVKKPPQKRKTVKVESEVKQEIDIKHVKYETTTYTKQNMLEVPKTNKRKLIILPQKEKLSAKIEIKQENIDSVNDPKQRKVERPKSNKNVGISPEKDKFNAETEIKQEIKCEKTGAILDAEQCTLDAPKQKLSKKASVSAKKLKTDGKGSKPKAGPEKEVKNVIGDIENGGWEPANWKKVYENILIMRKLYIAPVDSLGCEACPDKDVSPEVFRYQTLISVMLSSQTKDQVTYAATQRLIGHGLNVDSILKTSDEKIGELIYPAGFWKSKVKFIKQTTEILKDQYDSDIPRTFKELCKLPGVGPKMANIVMSVAWNDTVGIAVDTHVHRISNRIGWVPKPTKDAEQTRKALESWLPKELWKDGIFDLVGFGQTICRSFKPSCKECLNLRFCPFGKNNKN